MGQVNRISKTGLELLKGFEGLRRRSAPLPNGGWIVGYGHTRSAREGVEVTEREAEYLLRYDLQEVEELVSHAIHAPLNQNEFDALVSLAWNIGREAFLKSDVVNYVNAGEMLAAAESFSAWRKARISGRLIVVDALVRRRTAEKNLFLSHPSGPPEAPSLIVRPELDVAASILALSDGALSIEARMNDPQQAVPVAPATDTSAFGLASVDTSEAGERVSDEAIEQASDAAEDAVEGKDDEASDKDSTMAAMAAAAAIAPSVVSDLPVDDADDETEIESELEDEASGSIWDPSDLDSDDHDELSAFDDDAEEDEDDLADEQLTAAMAAASLAVDQEDDEADDSADADIEAVAEVEAAYPEEDDASDASDEVTPVESMSEIPTLADLIDEPEDEPKTEAEAETEEGDDVLTVTEVDLEDLFDDEDETEASTEEEAPVVETEERADDEKTDFVSLGSLDGVLSDDELKADNEADTTDDVEVIAVRDASDEDVDMGRPAAWDRDDTVSYQDAEFEDIDPEDTKTAPKATIVDPLFDEATSDLDEAEVAEAEDQKSWLMMLPFALLALIGLGMAILGVIDWLSLIRSETPVNENQLYAGPFLTLIGGFGFIFGGYFLIRKLFVK